MQIRCDRCGRFFSPAKGGSWVSVPACDIPGEWGDERERCVDCTEKYGALKCAPKYRAELCCGVYGTRGEARE
jgi:hypothetical protein